MSVTVTLLVSFFSIFRDCVRDTPWVEEMVSALRFFDAIEGPPCAVEIEFQFTDGSDPSRPFFHQVK